MDYLFPALVIGAAAFPICILIPLQIYLSLHSGKLLLKMLPTVFSFAALLLCWAVIPMPEVLKLLSVLYCFLMLILCGAGWVIAYSIGKSKRTTKSEQ